MKHCSHQGCIKWARSGYDYCVAHGGGPRCQHDGCTKAVKGDYCVAHGGGPRCQHDDCNKLAQGK